MTPDDASYSISKNITADLYHQGMNSVDLRSGSTFCALDLDLHCLQSLTFPE